MAVCSLPRCNKKATSRGLCHGHYCRQRAGGNIYEPSVLEKTIEQRLAEKTDVQDNGCHVWTGMRTEKGYGLIGYNGRSWRVHRLVYELAYAPIPRGWIVCHRCDNPPCINPEHLFIGKPKDNTRDMMRKGRAAQGPGFPSGEEHPNTKLNTEAVRQIRRLVAEGRSQRSVAKSYGVSQGTVASIAARRTWAHV